MCADNIVDGLDVSVPTTPIKKLKKIKIIHLQYGYGYIIIIFRPHACILCQVQLIHVVADRFDETT